MSEDCPRYAYDIYTEKALAHEATFYAADKAAWKSKREKQDAEYAENLAAVARTNPWPTDPTALHGARMGLQEWITERGD